MVDRNEVGAATATDLIGCVATVVSAFVRHNSLPSGELPAFISAIQGTIARLVAGAGAPEPAPEPAVPIKRSITRNFLICLDDGKKCVSLQRHLARIGTTPDAYRAKWGLPRDYPMVAQAYSEKRSALAKAFGLGQMRATAKSFASGSLQDASAVKPKRRRRARKGA